jgi:penicillin V acylase-like amidase (Ntn superfamily)
MTDPNHPNISMTLRRSVAGQGARVYYFESAIMPAVFWVNLNKVDFKKGSVARKIAIDPDTELRRRGLWEVRTSEALQVADDRIISRV